MATGQLTTVIEHLRRAALRQDVAGMTDGELLGAFLARQDAAALEMLVRRHAGMVHGVCRRVLGHPADADDAFQATFLVLVRRAASIVPREKVGNWLYGVAYKTALTAKRTLARRRAREKQVPEMPQPPANPELDRIDLQQLLDQELSQLPEKYRLPVVLCDLEGRTRREVARQLRLPDGTLSNRLAAGRQRLARRLQRRGLALSAGAVAALLEKEASAQAPVALVAATVNTAIQVVGNAGALAALVPAPVGTLTQGVLHTMWLTKLKLTVALVLTLGTLGAGTAWTWQVEQDTAPPPAGKTAAPQEDAAKKARARSKEILRDALKELNNVMDDGRGLRHRVLADMAALQAQLGDRTASRKLFEEARDLVAALTEENQRDGEWRMLATAEAKAGEADEAIATARRIPGGQKMRAYTLQEVGTELAKARREKDALRVAALVEDAEIKGWLPGMLLEHVALAHAKAGDFAQAMRVVERMKEPSCQVSALAGVVYLNLWNTAYPNEPGVALLRAEAGDKAGARKTLRRAADLAGTVSEEQAKHRALTAVACAQARLGDIAAARKTLEAIGGENCQAIAQATIGRALVGAGQVKEALALADRQPTKLMRMFVLMHVGAGQTKAGDRKSARETLRRVHLLLGQMDAQERGGQPHNLASAQAEAGDYQGAIETAEAFLAEGSLAKVNVAFTRAEAGDFAGALEMAGQMPESDWWKGNLLRGIGKLQAQRGREKAALEWIVRLNSPLERANALLGVAEGLVEAKK
jgi:RNA polymerase sigma factor (sigma-70 family)